MAWDLGVRVVVPWESSVSFIADEESSVTLQLPLHPAFPSALRGFVPRACSHIRAWLFWHSSTDGACIGSPSLTNSLSLTLGSWSTLSWSLHRVSHGYLTSFFCGGQPGSAPLAEDALSSNVRFWRLCQRLGGWLLLFGFTPGCSITVQGSTFLFLCQYLAGFDTTAL